MTQYIAVRDEGCGFGFSYCGPFHRLARAERFKAELEKVSPNDPSIRLVALEDPADWLPDRARRNGHQPGHSSLLTSGSAAPAADPTPGERSS